MLSPEEGRARIAEYATPTKIEDWGRSTGRPDGAGARIWWWHARLYTPGKSKARSSGFSSAYANTLFPTEQFVDGRPVTGLAAIVEAIGDLRAAWLWLREAQYGGSPAPPPAGAPQGRCNRQGRRDGPREFLTTRDPQPRNPGRSCRRDHAQILCARVHPWAHASTPFCRRRRLDETPRGSDRGITVSGIDPPWPPNVRKRSLRQVRAGVYDHPEWVFMIKRFDRSGSPECAALVRFGVSTEAGRGKSAGSGAKAEPGDR